MSKQIDLSIVIPVYNSSDIFPELYRRIVLALQHVVPDFEIIAVLDGCSDNSFDVIFQHCCLDKRVRLLELSRNFGHQAAICAGINSAKGEMVAIMDDDLEDPPEILPEFIGEIKKGNDVVYGIRKKRKRSFMYRQLYSLFYRLLDKFVDIKMPYDAGDFCIMRSQVVKVLNSMPETNKYLRGLRVWSGFKQTGLEYERGERYANLSGYSFKKYIALAMDAIFSFSYKPLRFISVVGTVIALLSFAFGIAMISLKLLDRVNDVPGWVSLLLSVLFLSGMQLISIGIMGEYILRIYDEVKQRPKYIIKRSVGPEGEDNNVRLGK